MQMLLAQQALHKRCALVRCYPTVPLQAVQLRQRTSKLSPAAVESNDW